MTTGPGDSDSDGASDSGSSGAGSPSEAERLAEENARLRAELAAATPTVSRRRVRRTIAAFLAGLTAVLLVVGVVAQWTSQTALDTDKFVARVGPVVEDPTVRAGLATELGNQLVSVLDLPTRVGNVLPDNLRFLAGPISAGMETVVRRSVTKLVDSEQFITLWYAALRLAHTQVVTVLTGSNEPVQVVNGQVVVNLLGVIGQVLDQLEQDAPAIFGTAVLSRIPDNLPLDQIRPLVSRLLGISLPETLRADPGHRPVLAGDRAPGHPDRQPVVVLLVLLGAVLAFVLALVTSVNRRRTLVQIGLATAVLTAVVFFAARALTSAAIAGVGDATLRPAVQAASRELFSSLRGLGALLFWVSLALALVAYLVGPGRAPRALRGWAVAGYRWSSEQAQAVAANEGYASWVARNMDPLRIGGVVVAAVLLLILSSWTALIVIGVLLVLYEVGVTLYARSTPAAAAEVDAETGVAGGTT